MSEDKNDTTVEGDFDPSKKVSWEDVKNSASKSEEAKPEVKEESTSKTAVETTTSDAPEVDYEKELAKYKEKAEREKELRKWEREQRRKLERELDKRDDESGSGSEETPDITTLVKNEVETLRRSEREDVIDDVLSDLSGNPHERELVRKIYDNELKPSGFSKKAIKEDLEKAFLIANRQRLESVAFRKAKGKILADQAQEKAMRDAASTGGTVGRQPPHNQPQYSPQEQRWLDRVGKNKADGD